MSNQLTAKQRAADAAQAKLESKVYEHAMIHVRASGPVTRISIECWMLDQTADVNLDNVKYLTKRFIGQALMFEQIEIYDPQATKLSYDARY